MCFYISNCAVSALILSFDFLLLISNFQPVFTFSFLFFNLIKQLKTSGCLIQSFIKKIPLSIGFFHNWKELLLVIFINSKYHTFGQCMQSSHGYLLQNLSWILALVEETLLKFSGMFIFLVAKIYISNNYLQLNLTKKSNKLKNHSSFFTAYISTLKLILSQNEN